METKEVLEKVKTGELSVEEAEQFFKKSAFEELGYAKLDTNREIRSGFQEVIYCQGKADDHLVGIVRRLYEVQGEVLGTRASVHQYELLKNEFPELEYNPLSHIIKIEKEKEHKGKIVVCSAGTADLNVAEEAAQTAEFFGSHVERLYDAICTMYYCGGRNGRRSCKCYWWPSRLSCYCSTYISGLWSQLSWCQCFTYND